MFIENNVGKLDGLFVELLIVLNNLYKKGVITNVTVYAFNKKWDNISNTLSLFKPTQYEKYSRVIIDLTKDCNNNDVDTKILNYEIGKALPEEIKTPDGIVVFYKLAEVVIPLMLT